MKNEKSLITQKIDGSVDIFPTVKNATACQSYKTFFPSSFRTNKLDCLALLSLIFAGKAEAYQSGALNGANSKDMIALRD
jgi:hypothetical protein